MGGPASMRAHSGGTEVLDFHLLAKSARTAKVERGEEREEELWKMAENKTYENTPSLFPTMVQGPGPSSATKDAMNSTERPKNESSRNVHEGGNWRGLCVLLSWHCCTL